MDYVPLSNRFATFAVHKGVDIDEKQISEAISDCAMALCPPIRHPKNTSTTVF